MRWFKHLTEAWDDEKIARLVGAGGKEGLAMYGAYWRILEIVAGQTQSGCGKCEVQYSVTRWSVLLSVRGSHVSHYLGHMAKIGLVTVEWIGSDAKVTIPNLLKYRDEYSRKSGHTQDDKARTELDTELDTTSSVLATLQKLIPTTDEKMAAQIEAAARKAKRDVTIPELCAALVATFRGSAQKSAGLWLHTIGPYLQRKEPVSGRHEAKNGIAAGYEQLHQDSEIDEFLKQRSR